MRFRVDHFDAAEFPTKKAVTSHPKYCLGILPNYPVGVRRGGDPHNIDDQYLIPAVGAVEWIEGHPTEHEELRAAIPELWRSVARDLELEP